MPLTGPVSLVIFDLDGVLCEFHPRRRAEYLAQVTGRDPDWIQATIWDSPFETAAESGEYHTGDSYLAAFNQRLGSSVTRDQWVTARRLAMHLRPGMVALLRSLQSRVRLAILTNNGALLRDTLPVLAPDLCALLGPHIHVTCDLGARKPEPLVYTRLLESYRLPAAQAVFMDDSDRNVRGARTAGLQAILFENEAQAAAELQRLCQSTV